MKKRFKEALKAAWKFALAGLIVLVVGIIVLITGLVLHGGAAPLIIGLLVIVAGIATLAFAFVTAKQQLHAICPDCEKYMGNSDKAVKYSFVCNQYKENYDNQNKFVDFTFYYTCTIVCPHCGSTSAFEYKARAKSEPKANEIVNKYLKSTLKITK